MLDSFRLEKGSDHKKLEKNKAQARLGLDANELKSWTSLFQAFKKCQMRPTSIGEIEFQARFQLLGLLYPSPFPSDGDGDGNGCGWRLVRCG